MALSKYMFMAIAMSLALLEGCGGSGDASRGEEGTLTKAAFIAQADAICSRTDQRQKEAHVAFLKRYPEADTSKVWEEKFGLIVGLLPIQTETKELAALPAPTGDQEEITAIISGIEEFVKKAQEVPSILLAKGSVEPIAKVEKLARAYGFEACVFPI